MRVFLLPGFFFLATVCFAQSKKDSLFSGKMKVDSATLARSKAGSQKAATDSMKKTEPVTVNKTAGDTEKKSDNAGNPQNPSAEISSNPSADAAGVVAAGNTNAPMRYEDNNKVWKKFIDEYSAIINNEVMTSKKIKRGTYSILLEYEIGTDGVVTTKNVTSTPENKFLVEQINERMMPNAPQLAPMIRDGVARKSSKRQVINFTKEKN